MKQYRTYGRNGITVQITPEMRDHINDMRTRRVPNHEIVKNLRITHNELKKVTNGS